MPTISGPSSLPVFGRYLKRIVRFELPVETHATLHSAVRAIVVPP